MIKIKTPSEIVIMKQSGQILAKVIDEARKYVKAGQSTKELDIYISNLIGQSGARPSFKGFHGYPASSCISINEEVVHAIPGNRIIKNGDIVSIDVGVLYKGYHSDSAITIGIGKISKEAQNLIKITKKSLNNGIKKIKPGIKIGDIQSEIQKTIESAGFFVIRDLTGHGIGCELQEDPSIPNFGRKGTGFILKEGMVIAIEPMASTGTYRVIGTDDEWTVVTLDKSLSAHFEHTIAITTFGCEILTKLNNKGVD